MAMRSSLLWAFVAACAGVALLYVPYAVPRPGSELEARYFYEIFFEFYQGARDALMGRPRLHHILLTFLGLVMVWGWVALPLALVKKTSAWLAFVLAVATAAALFWAAFIALLDNYMLTPDGLGRRLFSMGFYAVLAYLGAGTAVWLWRARAAYRAKAARR